MVRYLDEASVRAVLRWDPLIAAMESALAAFSSGQVIQPVRNMLTIEEGKRYLGIMPAVMQEAMGVKLVSFYPGNAGTGLPTHFGIILLGSASTQICRNSARSLGTGLPRDRRQRLQVVEPIEGIRKYQSFAEGFANGLDLPVAALPDEPRYGRNSPKGAGGATGRCAKQQAFAIRATGPMLHGLTS
jgi:hypothetical protein